MGAMIPAPRINVQRHDLGGLSPEQRGLIHHDVDAAETPILLVHGIVDNHSIFALLGRALRRRGFLTVSAYDYGLLTRDIRAVEAYADTRGPGRCLLPEGFLSGVGFKTQRALGTSVRMRMDLRAAVTWRRDVGAAWERLVDLVDVVRPAPSRQPGTPRAVKR